MTVEEAYEILRDGSPLTPGKFYQSANHLSLGVGKLYDGIRYPLLNLEDFVFDTLEGLVLILTHECDVDQENIRPFNDHLLVCPIIQLDDFIAEYSDRVGEDKLPSFLSNVASRNVSRVMYFPPLPSCLEYGGLIYLNQICSSHVAAFTKEVVKSVGAVSVYGLMQFDKHLSNHLLRPKAELLADF